MSLKSARRNTLPRLRAIRCVRRSSMLAGGLVRLRAFPLRSARFRHDVKLHPGLLLQVADDAEQVPRLRIAARSEHADETLGLRADRLAELFEADGRLDVVAQDR